MAKSKIINVQGREIALISDKVNDYISLTDMARYRDPERTNYIIQNWMRTRSAIEFCGLWEQLNNADFKGIEFDAFKISIIELLPKSAELYRTSGSHPVLNDIICSFRVSVTSHIRK